jgi:insulysin
LNKFGGSSNAFTSSTSTNYYFELSSSSKSNSPSSLANTSQSSLPGSKATSPLYGGLDRFAQFFIEPLFDADTLERELRAVDSENKKNLQSDNWRLMQLSRSTANKDHPVRHFATGSYKTLHDDPLARGVKIRDEFIGFYNKHYSANRMKLVVLGKEELDELESWVQEFFTAVPNQDLPKLRWDMPKYTEAELGMELFVKPVKEMRDLELSFPYPDEDDLHASKPGHYISHLVGHEGPGSILAYVKAKGWVESLSAGASTECPGTGVFHINLSLTEQGLKEYRQIVHVIFQYIAAIKEEPPQKWIVDEMMRLNEVRFKYAQQIPASRMTSGVSGQMQKSFPRNQLLSAQTLIREFNPKAISRGMQALTPDNLRLMLVGKESSTDFPLKEQWYGTEYKAERLPADYLQELREALSAPANSRPSELHLPGKNEFVPQRLDVEKKDVAKVATAPKLIRNDANVRTWWKKDDQFWVPKANIYLCLRNPINSVSPFTTLMSHLYKDLVEDSLSEYSYDADIAGLSWGLNSAAIGLDVNVKGYNDKAAVLLEKAVIAMRDLEVKDDRFEIMKERLMRTLRNFEWSDPYNQVSSYTRWLSQPRGWAMFELLEELPAITAADVRAWYPQLLRQMHIEMLVQGNLYKEDALHMTNLVERTLQPRRYSPDQWQPKRSLVLAPGSDHRWSRTLANPDNINHCIDYVLQIGSPQDRPLRAKLLLMAQILNEPCFDTLRTKQQLGYVVWSLAMTIHTTQAFRVIIQSEKDCGYLEERIDAFLTDFEPQLRDMEYEEFEKHKVSLINKRLEKLKNLGEEGGRLWHHITSEEFDFDLGTFSLTFPCVSLMLPLTC